VTFLQGKTGVIHVPEGAPLRTEWLGLPRAEIISIHGRNPHDIWFLTEDQTVLHDDGKRIVDRYVEPCGWGNYGDTEGGVSTRFAQILVDKEKVHVLGESRDPYTRVGGDLTATLSKNNKKWSCKEQGITPALAASFGDHTWKLAHNMASAACRLRALDGPCASPPSWAPSYAEPSGDAVDMGIDSIALWMFGVDDGFIVTFDDEGRLWIHRYNGVAWSPVAALDKEIRIMNLWADDERHLWLTARRGGHWGDPATMILHFDGKALRALPVPASFKTRFVHGTSARDVWFFGAAGKVYQWDGETLRQGAVSSDASDGWSSLGGEVWLVSKDGVWHTAPLGEVR